MPATPERVWRAIRRRKRDPGTVRLRRRGQRRPRGRAPRRRRGDAKLLAGGRSLIALPAAHRASGEARRHEARLSDLDYVNDGGCVAIRRRYASRRHRLRRPPCRALPDHLARGRRDRHDLGASPRHARRHARARRPGVGHAGGDARARRRARRPRLRWRAGDPGAEFFTGVFETALGHDEVLVEARVPGSPPRPGWAYLGEPSGPGLGDGRGCRARPPRQRLDRRRLDRPGQRRHAAQSTGRRGRARRRRLDRRRRLARDRGHRASERPRGLVRVPRAPGAESWRSGHSNRRSPTRGKTGLWGGRPPSVSWWRGRREPSGATSWCRPRR